MKRSSLLILPMVLFLGSAASAAEPNLPKLPYELGTSRVEPGGDSFGIYSVTVSGPLDSKSQQIRLIAYWDGPDAETKGFINSTRSATITSGKSKTLRAVTETVREALNRFIASPQAPGQALAKVGDLKYGGELLIIAESGEVVRFDFVKPEGLTSVRFGKKEAVEFAKILSNLPSAGVPAAVR